MRKSKVLSKENKSFVGKCWIKKVWRGKVGYFSVKFVYTNLKSLLLMILRVSRHHWNLEWILRLLFLWWWLLFYVVKRLSFLSSFYALENLARMNIERFSWKSPKSVEYKIILQNFNLLNDFEPPKINVI